MPAQAYVKLTPGRMPAISSIHSADDDDAATKALPSLAGRQPAKPDGDETRAARGSPPRHLERKGARCRADSPAAMKAPSARAGAAEHNPHGPEQDVEV